MTDIESAFIADIVAHPAEDWPRLIYADWCEDNGRTERAEFIRVQCEIARLEEAYGVKSLTHDSPTSDEWDALRCREAKLANAHLASWCAMPGWTTLTGSDEWGNPANGRPWSVFRRGFVALVRCPLRAWLKHGKELCRDHPIEAVTLTGVRPAQVNPGKRRFQFHPDHDFVEDGPAQPASVLPASFRKHMTRNSGTCYDDAGRAGGAGRACCYDYDAEADALADASAAALAWAEENPSVPSPEAL